MINSNADNTKLLLIFSFIIFSVVDNNFYSLPLIIIFPLFYALTMECFTIFGNHLFLIFSSIYNYVIADGGLRPSFFLKYGHFRADFILSIFDYGSLVGNENVTVGITVDITVCYDACYCACSGACYGACYGAY